MAAFNEEYINNVFPHCKDDSDSFCLPFHTVDSLGTEESFNDVPLFPVSPIKLPYSLFLDNPITFESKPLYEKFDSKKDFLHTHKKVESSKSEQKQKEFSQTEEVLTCEKSRKWKVISKDKDVQIDLFLHGRREKKKEEVDRSYYQSIRYDLNHNIIFKNNSEEKTFYVIPKIRLLYEDNMEEVVGSKGKAITEDSVPQAVTAGKNRINFITQISFQDCSYHHSKRKFCFEIVYTLNGESNKKIAQMKSPAFMVYARKKQLKRKRKSSGNSSKRQKTEQMIGFNNSLDEMLSFLKTQSLSQNEMKKAFKKIREELLPQFK